MKRCRTQHGIGGDLSLVLDAFKA